MAHHDNHDHGNDAPKKLHEGYFEVPLALGAFLWILVILLIRLNCWSPNGGCCEGESCEKESGNTHKTEMPTGHH